jgi:hypothetical protein
MYLGGIASARNGSFYPSFAVSYAGLNSDFAALVLDDDERVLKVLFYNFDGQSQSGGMRVWNLKPGTYRVSAGPDLNDDDEIDEVESTQIIDIERTTTIPIILPSRKSWIVSISCLEEGSPLSARSDLAVASDLITKDNGVLSVPVYNIGSVSAANVEVQLLSSSGEILGRQVIGKIDAPSGWVSEPTLVKFKISEKSPEQAYEIKIDPDHKIPEITRVNNRAVWSKVH